MLSQYDKYKLKMIFLSSTYIFEWPSNFAVHHLNWEVMAKVSNLYSILTQVSQENLDWKTYKSRKENLLNPVIAYFNIKSLKTK